MIDVQIRRVNDDNISGGRRQHGTITGIHAIIVSADVSCGQCRVRRLPADHLQGQEPDAPAGIVVVVNTSAILTREGAMANEPDPDRGAADLSTPGEQPDTTPEQRLVVSLPDYEVQQIDSAQLSAAHMGVGSITRAAMPLP
jgi:hypothetical protein